MLNFFFRLSWLKQCWLWLLSFTLANQAYLLRYDIMHCVVISYAALMLELGFNEFLISLFSVLFSSLTLSHHILFSPENCLIYLETWCKSQRVLNKCMRYTDLQRLKEQKIYWEFNVVCFHYSPICVTWRRLPDGSMWSFCLFIAWYTKHSCMRTILEH